VHRIPSATDANNADVATSLNPASPACDRFHAFAVHRAAYNTQNISNVATPARCAAVVHRDVSSTVTLATTSAPTACATP
jgi:hypothetical protein